MIIIADRNERDIIGKTSIDTLLTVIKGMELKQAIDDIIAVKRLPSGDILLITLTKESRLELERNHEWLRAITNSAKVKRNTFLVLVHAVRIAGVDITN